MAKPTVLNRQSLLDGTAWLCRRDDDLAVIANRYGPPPLWGRTTGFPTLVRIILEQQVSLASADAAYRKLKAVMPRMTPSNFLLLDDTVLLRSGFSRQKTTYCRELATAICERRLNLKNIKDLADDRARDQLKTIKGIGDWTADIYLLMAVRRPDIWPRGDLALVKALRDVKRLENLPAPDEFDAIGENWRPWRAVAARLLWHYYLRSSQRRNG